MNRAIKKILVGLAVYVGISYMIKYSFKRESEKFNKNIKRRAMAAKRDEHIGKIAKIRKAS
ncbi:MAG: hypothetical protein Q4E88_03330 [Coriobacteriia bacterium]|nr:hypothetical protein [Coriobacteriia bacterium]